MPVIHKDLCQVLNAEADGIDTYNIDDDHPWMLGVQPSSSQKWAWHPIDNEPVLVGKNQKWNSDSSQFEDDADLVLAELVAAKNAKVARFSIECGKRISLPFTSDALGVNGAYRCNSNDQEKMRVAKESESGGKIWVGEVFTSHTQAQAQIVYDLAMAQVDSVTTEYSDKYLEIQSATTKAEVDAITWPET